MTLVEKIIIASLILLAVNVFFWGIVFPSIKYNYIENKQSKCFLLWRRMDGDYAMSVTFYKYRCQKCKTEKELDQYASRKFERDFMSDWDEHEE